MTEPIIIVDYDGRWPEHFETLCSRLFAALGPLAAAIEHVGSTAVPGLAAKPVIDLDVLLRSPSDLPAAISVLSSLGYEHRGDLGVPGREAFRAPADTFPHHLYVCPPDSPEYRRHIAFRDHLRTHPEVAREYAALKRKLAERFALHREAYNEGKTGFVEQILRTALAMEHFAPWERTIK